MTVSAGRPEQGKPEQQAGADPASVADPAEIEPDAQAMTRIVLRPIGSPLPLGYFTVAIDNVLTSTLQWGVLSAADRRAVALIVFPAFIVQAIAGLFALGARDSIAGTMMLSFATTSGSSMSCSRSSSRSCWPARSSSVPWLPSS
jgi:uncharacterized protein